MSPDEQAFVGADWLGAAFLIQQARAEGKPISDEQKQRYDLFINLARQELMAQLVHEITYQRAGVSAKGLPEEVWAVVKDVMAVPR